MLRAIIGFELRFWLRGMMVWVFMLIIAFMIGGALSSDSIRVGGSLGNTYKNAPYVIQQFYAITGILTMLMTTAFVNSAAARDFTNNTSQILFSTPMRRFDFLVGRYIGAIIVSIIPMMGVSLAALVVKYMPWVDADRWGPVRWDAHVMGVLLFAVPDTIFIAAVIFAIAALTRSTVATFLGGLFLLVALALSDTFLEDLSNERLGILLDPFGANAYSRMTKYWTVADKNNLVLGFEGDLLLNRLIWIAVGIAIFAFAYFRFSFAERAVSVRKLRKQIATPEVEIASASAPIPSTSWSADTAETSRMSQFLGAIKTEFFGLVKSTVFIVVLVAALLNCVPSLMMASTEGYGNNTYPVTYWILDIITGTLYLFVIAIITFFAGMLVWKERDARMDEIHDALPYPDWISYSSKLIAIIGSVLIILALAMFAGIAVQAWQGYHRYQIGLYFTDLFGMDATLFLMLSILAFLFHVISPNKYVGYFAFIAFLIANFFSWGALNISSLMVRYAGRPQTTYSDMFGRAPYWSGWGWFTAYWLLFAGVLAAASIIFWRRGKEMTWAERWRVGKQRFEGSLKATAVGFLLAFVTCGFWVYYNTKVINHVEGPKDEKQRQADYEKAYKKFEKVTPPRVTTVKYNIDIFPETRNLVLKGEQTLVNKTTSPIDKIYFTIDEGFDHDLQVDGGKRTAVDERLNFWTYELSPPMQPGETRMMRFTTKSRTYGFENSLSNPRLVQNGTFFNNGIAPQIGYQSGGELSDPNDRKKYGLPAKDLMPALERNCTVNCGNSYLSSSSDWVDLETTISTSEDQMAIAPGSLIKEWVKDGRRYAQYKFDRASANFYSFISAKYKVAREEWNGVKIEVYYHPEHEWNVPKMLKSIRKSLEYCSENFGPYGHKQARIIEFPRIARFAQAFPGTMPYSEGIGFIANLSKPDDIDMVYYIVAHEMAHQWWAHQVLGANMQGATLLSETMAQYTALMIMEKEYGRDMMRKFLEYEMDRYLRSRGSELLKERPMLKVEASQGYIHYRKGSVVMYYLKEMIGEDAINRALRKLVQKFGYAQPPYPTSYDLVDALREETPEDKQYLLKDLFEDITLFSNRTLNATATKRSDGKYDVTIEVEAHKYKSDEKGNETEAKLDDWIEVGAFAKPEKGKKYGATLHRERVRLTENKKTFQFVTAQVPEKAGIDPFHLLVDRIPDDNVKKLPES
jgi:ABC-2 type transport system permease protein